MKSIALFPSYFKIIAALLAVAGVVVFLLQTSGYHLSVLYHDEDFFVSLSLIIAALAIATFTKERIESDFIRHLRAALLPNAFQIAVGFALTQPLINLFIGLEHIPVSAHYILFISLSYYLTLFTLSKKTGVKKVDQKLD